MNEEIKKAIEILKQPITVNCVDYHYFTQDQYDNLMSAYDNALWLLNIYDQILKEYQQLKIQVSAREEVANKLQSTLEEIREYINTHKLFYFEPDEEELFEYVTDLKVKQDLLQIIDKGVKNE